jgi:ABC-2 type transport system ATP-binding protein
MQDQKAIIVSQLSKSYGLEKVVDALSFAVEKGKVFGLLGANGAGKTTSIECILGTKKMDEGNVQILGLNPVSQRKLLFQKVGVQFQESNYQREIKVYELCEETAALYRNPRNYNELLDRFGIREQKKSLVKDLSGGQRQRLFIILALIPDPDIIFMDELTTGLDVKARRDVWKILKKLKSEGMTMVLTSHFMDEVEALCDEIVILKKGKVAYQGSVPDAIQNSPYEKFEDAYLWFAGEDEEVDKDEEIL